MKNKTKKLPVATPSAPSNIEHVVVGRENVMNRAYFWALLGLLVVGATVGSVRAAVQVNEAAATSLTITGVVVDETGALLASEKLWLLGNNFSIKLDGKGTVLSPTVETDVKGAFSLKVDRALFPANEELTVALQYKDLRGMLKWAPLNDGRGVPATLKLDPKLRTLDLGKLTVKNR